MNNIIIRTRNAEFRAQLDDSDISNYIWLEAPHKLDINMLGSMIYCEMPMSVLLPKEGRTTHLEVGDIAYWPGPGAFCIFFGPTPLSGEDRKPVAPYPVIKIGKIVGDCSELSEAGDRQRLTIEQTFLSYNRERVVKVRQYLTSILSDQDRILDPYASYSRYVDSRLG